MNLETNIFPIRNLEKLKDQYRLYRILGLRRNTPDYFTNRDALIRHLNYELQTPCLLLERDDGPHVVIRECRKPVPENVPLVGVTVVLESVGGTLAVDFNDRSREQRAIALRFLNFLLQTPLFSNPKLWQPRSGGAFFTKDPFQSTSGLDLFRGFLPRATETPNGGIGICVDLRTKYVSADSLGLRMTRDNFRRLGEAHCVYKYGSYWLDVRLDDIADVPAGRFPVHESGATSMLSDFVARTCNGSLPAALVSQLKDGSVAYYRNNRGEERSAPTGMCHLVHDTESRLVRQVFHGSIAPPNQRRSAALRFVSDYLAALRIGDVVLSVDRTAQMVTRRLFQMPDLEFGGNTILSVRNTAGAKAVKSGELGAARLALLQQYGVGFFEFTPLSRQLLVLPASIHSGPGRKLLGDLKAAVERLFPHGMGYCPEVVSYEDRGRNIGDTRNAIYAAVKAAAKGGEHALLMLPDRRDHRKRQPDAFSATVVSDLRKLDVVAAMFHTRMTREAYSFQHGHWVHTQRLAGRLRGYLQNLAISKVLLANRRWPFVLATKLNADLVVGIDVKGNTAGFVAVAGGGRVIKSMLTTSKYRERLSRELVRKKLCELVENTVEAGGEPIRKFVVHRDGRVFQSELEGLEDAMKLLTAKGFVAPDVDLTVIEIPKNSFIPLRLFEASQTRDRDFVRNPAVGTYVVTAKDEGFVATTGEPFRHDGTANPLYVRVIRGGLSIEHCLEDVFALSCLAWTRPEDCSRYPITLKLADRFLEESGNPTDEEDEDDWNLDEQEEAILK